MSLLEELQQRSTGSCELCGVGGEHSVFAVPETNESAAQPDAHLMLCRVCIGGIESPKSVDSNHWRCLNNSIWSQVPAVQVMTYRILHGMSDQSWTQELLDSMYLDESTKAWAEAAISSAEDDVPTLDSNGAKLADGDTVTLIKDLAVKGAGFTAKRGTTVKNISLTSNPMHIEGRVNGTQIVLVAAFLKKA